VNSIELFGVVGTDVRAEDVRLFLKDNDGLPVRVVIDSPGGNLSEGVLIYNMLKDHSGEVTTVNVARAYSIASYIFLAGSVREMNDNALLMTHEARVDANALTESGMDKIRSMLSAANASIRKAYARVMGVDESMVQTLWDGGTDVWYTSDQAIEAGLSTETITAGDGLRAEYITELVAFAPEYIIEKFTNKGGDMPNKVTIEALEKMGCPAGFILEQIKAEATEIDALRAYVDILRAEDDEEKPEEEKADAEDMPEEKEEADAEEGEEKPEGEEDKPECEACPHCGQDMPEEADAEEGEEEKKEEEADAEEEKEEADAEEEKKEEADAEDDEEEKDEEPKAKAGVEPVAVARVSNGQFSSASQAWKQQIADRCRETGCSSTDAVIFLNKNNPGLRQLVIDEANNKR